MHFERMAAEHAEARPPYPNDLFETLEAAGVIGAGRPTEQVRRLFATFSNWSPEEVRRAAEAAEQLGGTVTEHYRTVLHLTRRAASSA